MTPATPLPPAALRALEEKARAVIAAWDAWYSDFYGYVPSVDDAVDGLRLAVAPLPTLLSQLARAGEENARLNAVLAQTHANYCTEAWTSRGLHAPECLLQEVSAPVSDAAGGAR